MSKEEFNRAFGLADFLLGDKEAAQEAAFAALRNSATEMDRQIDSSRKRLRKVKDPLFSDEDFLDPYYFIHRIQTDDNAFARMVRTYLTQTIRLTKLSSPLELKSHLSEALNEALKAQDFIAS